MFRLAVIVFVLAATVLAGVVVTALLSASIYDRTMLASGALAGVVVAIPVAWLVARQLYTLTRQ
jgi:hypothetical protein